MAAKPTASGGTGDGSDIDADDEDGEGASYVEGGAEAAAAAALRRPMHSSLGRQLDNLDLARVQPAVLPEFGQQRTRRRGAVVEARLDRLERPRG